MARRIKSLEELDGNVRLNISSLKYIPRFIKDVRKVNPLLFYGNVLLRLISAVFPIVQLYIAKLIIDLIVEIYNGEIAGVTNELWYLIGIELGLVVIADIVNRVSSISESLLGDQYSIASSTQLIDKTAEVEIYQLEDPEFYDKLERARQQTNGRVSLLSNIMGQGQDLFTIIQYIAALIFFEPWLILIVILSIIPSFINDLKFSSTSYSLSRGWTAERRELDYLRYIGANNKTAKEIKLFGLVEFISSRFKNLSLEYYRLNRKLAIRRGMWGTIFNVLGTIAYYGAYVLIIFRVITRVLTIGDLTFLSSAFTRLKNKLSSSFSRFTKITNSALNLKDYFEFMDLEAEKYASFDRQPMPKSINDGLVIENVSFTYPGEIRPVLQNVSFKIKAGETMAFVGENGAGKTTLIKLILRFYELDQGRILLDGVDIRHFDKLEYQNFFGVIFQDYVKYEFSVRDNIAIGDINEIENLDLIKDSAEHSLALPIIENLPEQFEQQLGRRFANGAELSGGQWQKVALARAYMANGQFMILDEPTASLDARAEYEAFQRFIGLTKGKTSIIISHRFSTVRMADRILVLKDGGILEIGTHEELMANQQLYSELFQLQAAGYQ